MPSVRLGYLPSGIYQVAATSGPASAAPRYQAPCISGRLAHPSIVPCTGQNSCRFSPAGVTTPWMGNQFQQVRLGSQPAVRFYRHAVQHVRLHRGTSTQNAGQNPEHPRSLEITPAHIRQGSPQTFGYVDIHGHSCAKRSTTPPPNPVVGVRGMVIVYDSATVADSAQHQDPAAADSTRPQNSAGDDSALPQDPAGDDSTQPQVSARDNSARDDGPAAQGTPAGNATVDRQDASIVSDVSSLIFPSMPRRINQETLLDFMSMWTLMQCRMDGPTAQDAQSRPVRCSDTDYYS